MRTDSTRISEEARAEAKKIIENDYGKKYYENRYYKSSKDAQDAHEAIRPTYLELSPEKTKQYLSNDQFKLYKLIYNRFLASQMASAIFDTITVKIDANDEYNFRANGQTIKFKGFMIIYSESTDDNKKEEFIDIPDLIEKQILKKEKLESKQSFTEPPPRYTEASLVKVLEEKGIRKT